MARPGDQAFPKETRLRKRAEYLKVQQEGQRVESRAFIGLFLAGARQEARLGITTTKRLGHAVQRNRARRLVREAFRQSRLDLPAGVDLIVIPKRRALELDTALLFDDLSRLGRSVRRALER
jgi:ribonuclease P protein component